MSPKSRLKRFLTAFCFLGVIALSAISLSAATGYAQAGGTIAVNSPTVEIDADSVGDVVTIGGSRNTVQTAVAPEAETAQNQGSAWLIVPIVLATLVLAVVGVYYLLISGALVTAVDTILLWRKS